MRKHQPTIEELLTYHKDFEVMCDLSENTPFIDELNDVYDTMEKLISKMVNFDPEEHAFDLRAGALEAAAEFRSGE